MRKTTTLTLFVKLTLSIGLVLFLASPALAQPQLEMNKDYLIEEFVLPGGPSGNSVNCIVQGPNGFLWFGSHTGLNRYDGYHFKLYKSNPEDSTSLAFSYIEWLFWSLDNYLWIGTYGGGLFRFDPNDESFVRYHHHPADPTSLSNDQVTYIIEESKDILWVGTTGGLNRLDRTTGQFERFLNVDNDPTSLSFNDVRTLYIDRQETLWVGTGFFYQDDLSQGGLNRFNPETKTFTRYLHQPDDPKSLMGNVIKAIYEDSKGNFWVGSLGGLQKMDRKAGTFRRMLDDPKVAGDIFAPGIQGNEISSVFSLLEDKSENLWIFNLHDDALSSIGKVDLRTNQMEIIRERANIIPWQTMQSTDGSIWLAGAGIGARVHKIRPGNAQVKYLPFIDASEGRGISFEGLVAQGDSLLWGKTSSADGTPQILGIRNTGRNWGIRNLPEVYVKDHNTPDRNLFYQNEGVGLVLDRTGILWGCTGSTNGGLFNMHPHSPEVQQYLHDPNNPNSPQENEIRYLMEDKQGNIWMANRNSVSRLDPVNMQFTHYLHNPNDPSSLSDAVFFTLFEDRDGYIWIGGIGPVAFGGTPSLDRLDPATGKVKRAYFPPDIQVSRVLAITQNLGGDIFFLVSGRTLSVLYHEHLMRGVWDQTQTQEDFMGSTFQNANNLIADNQGILWLTDRDGRILRVDSETQSVTAFDDRQGLEFTEMRAFKLADGTIYFAYQEGLVAINPLDKTSDQLHFQSSQVRFTEFFLNGKSIAQGKQTVLDRPVWQMSQLNLSHHQGNFGLRFSAFDFKKPQSSQYEVRLLPYEIEWRRVEGDPLINYYQLPPGDYTLEVKGSDSNGIWAKETAKMDIHIAPPWWKSGWAYGLYTIIFAFGVLGVHRFQKERVIRKERDRTKDRELAQAKEIEKAYEKLKSTQNQLIHSEKMASLGELTAGIAHEIQNPLNFVNNFSEVNKELIEELKEAQVKGDQAEIDAITKDILENEGKIMHHGKRAEAIVKSMLQHSRISTGEKELTDINALADEYLRLAYHGFRAKDKSFNADFKTELADDLPRIEVVPQDIGRVLLNLINNAFQAVSAEALAKVGSDYKPTVTVSTSKKDEKVEIRVRDNGPGIPKNIKDKIFQPFFTTKPAGEGTGLGLSLSYDIVTKGHGGELKLETGEEMGTKFIILIPIK